MTIHRLIRHRMMPLLLATALLIGVGAVRAQPTSLHLTLGNPSGAVTDVNFPTNYLIVRDQYALAYNRDRGIPTWVSWHLAASDLGTVDRYSGNFFTDTSLPAGWYRVTHGDYLNSGYDRGHMTPSADRTASTADNEATFLLTNILPQAPANNQGLWAQLEEYARTRVGQGNEVYIIAGSAGNQGTLAGGKLTIPTDVWKVLLILPAADGDDLARVTTQTEVIAVWTPNSAAAQGQTWQSYQTTVRCLEQRLGLDLLGAVADAVETMLEGEGCLATSGTPLYLPFVFNSQTTPTPVTPTPVTPTPVTPTPVTPNITIVEILADPPGVDLDGEYVRLRNTGGSAVTMTNWTLRDAVDTVYTFPTFTLAPSGEVRVWVKSGTDDATNLYWGRGSPVWNNTGDTAILRNASGAEIARLSYP